MFRPLRLTPYSFDCGGDIYGLVLSTLAKTGVTGQGQQES